VPVVPVGTVVPVVADVSSSVLPQPARRSAAIVTRRARITICCEQ
jgi:hypothetical protein